MDPIRAIAPLVALASFATVIIRALFTGASAVSAMGDALLAMGLGFVVGSVCAMVVRHVVTEHNQQYFKANPVPPLSINMSPQPGAGAPPPG